MFPSTRWTVLAQATLAGDPAGREALEHLCLSYRPAVLSFLRLQGCGPADAEDLTQDLFLKLLKTRAWKKADRTRGHFRTFLLSILQHMVANKRAGERTQKNGGAVASWSLEWLEEESGWTPAVSEPEPCAEFDKAWAARTLRAAFACVEKRWVEHDKGAEFAVYRRFLPGSGAIPAFADIARQLGIANTAARTTVSRLRLELAEALRQEVAITVNSPDDIEAELSYLGRVLARPGSNL